MPALWLAYPVLVHLAVITQMAALQSAALGWLGLLFLLPALRSGKLWPWLALAGVVLLSALAPTLGVGMIFLYLPPILMNAFLGLIFVNSLRAGRTPMISAVARQIRGDLSPAVATYTRRSTQAWVLIFFSMALFSAALALWADDALWSLFTNCLNYVIVVLIFLIEYLLRSVFLPNDPRTPVGEYVRGVVRTDFRKL